MGRGGDKCGVARAGRGGACTVLQTLLQRTRALQVMHNMLLEYVESWGSEVAGSGVLAPLFIPLSGRGPSDKISKGAHKAVTLPGGPQP